MQDTERFLPSEFKEVEYIKEVLHLDNTTEQAIDEALAREASALGIDVLPPTSLAHKAHSSVCDSAVTAASGRARTSSTDSAGSASTGITSRYSSEPVTIGIPSILRRRSSTGRPLSLSEYDRFSAQIEAQQGMIHSMPAEPAPSLFSVSTRMSYFSIKSGITRHFNIRRKAKASAGNLR